MKFTDTLTKQDVETVAKGRISRAESKRTNYMGIAAMILLVAGLFVLRISTAGGFALFVLGVGGFAWYTNGLSKKQNAMKQRCVADWQREIQERQEQDNLDKVARPQ